MIKKKIQDQYYIKKKTQVMNNNHNHKYFKNLINYKKKCSNY